MSTTPLVFSLVELLIAAAAVVVARVAWGYRDRTAGGPLFVMAVTTACYATVSALESVVVEPLAWRLLADLLYPLTAVIAVASFYLAAEFTRRERYRHPAVAAPLVGFVLASLAVSMTDPIHGLMIAERTTSADGAHIGSYGPFFWVHTVVALGIITWSVVLLSVEATKARGIYRKQIGAVVAAFLIGVGFFLWEVLAPVHPAFNLATVGIFGWCSVTLWGVFRADFLETAPVARKAIVDSVNDAVFALDTNDRITDVNPYAREEFDVETDAVGTPVAEVLAEYPALLEAIDASAGEREITLRKDGAERHFHLKVSPVYDARGSIGPFGPRNLLVGRAVVLRDITEQKRRERELRRIKDRLEEQRDTLELISQVARHDIRNDLQLVRSYAELLEDHVDEEGRAHLDVVRENAADAVERTTTARELSEMVLQTEVSIRRVPLREHLQGQIETVRSSHPDAVVTVEGAVPNVDVPGTDMLGSVFRNLLENAVKHSDEAVPEVTVSVREGDDRIEVRVADNGPGIPEGRREEVFERGEKGSESQGTGLGLYLVRTLVESYGGDVRIAGNEPKGAVFVVELPAGPESASGSVRAADG